MMCTYMDIDDIYNYLLHSSKQDKCVRTFTMTECTVWLNFIPTRINLSENGLYIMTFQIDNYVLMIFFYLNHSFMKIYNTNAYAYLHTLYHCTSRLVQHPSPPPQQTTAYIIFTSNVDAYDNDFLLAPQLIRWCQATASTY